MPYGVTVTEERIVARVEIRIQFCALLCLEATLDVGFRGPRVDSVGLWVLDGYSIVTVSLKASVFNRPSSCKAPSERTMHANGPEKRGQEITTPLGLFRSWTLNFNETS